MSVNLSHACELAKDRLSLPHLTRTGHVARKELSLGPPGILFSMAHPCLKAPQGLKVHWFSLFPVVMFYEVTTNPELTNTEPSVLGQHRVRFLRGPGHKIFVNRSIYNFVLHAFLFKDTLCNTYC